MLKTLILIIEYLFIILPVLIGVAYMTLVEREILASIQRRKGPNVVGVARSEERRVGKECTS